MLAANTREMKGNKARIFHPNLLFPLSSRYRNTRLVWLVTVAWVLFS